MRVKYGAVLRAQVYAEVLGLNPLENGEEGVSQLPKSGWSCCERKKGKKGKKAGFSSREHKKRFPLDHIFTIHFYRLWFHKNPYFSIEGRKIYGLWEKHFLKEASDGLNFPDERRCES